jgi:hypothetical protein
MERAIEIEVLPAARHDLRRLAAVEPARSGLLAGALHDNDIACSVATALESSADRR